MTCRWCLSRQLEQLQQIDAPTIRIAVDIPGELAELEQALLAAEVALTTAEVALAAASCSKARRELAEGTLRDTCTDWLGDSPRARALERATEDLFAAVQQLGAAAQQLGLAIRVSGSVDDELPF